MQLSIIIINYNVKYFLEQCLCSVSLACNNIEAEIIVVDNNSTDGSKDFFTGRFGHVKFTWNETNPGFGKANNLALKQAAGDYILFLNPDTIIPEDCLEKCLGFFKSRPDTGALGVRMIDGSGHFLRESKRSLPSLSTAFYKLSGLTAIFPHSPIFARYYLGQLDPHKNHEVDVLAGAFMMVEKKTLDETGGFDERFFMYGEDIDLSYRIQELGFKNIYFSETTIIHFKGESMKRGSLNYLRLFYGAMGLFVEKHYSTGFSVWYKRLVRTAIGGRAMLSATIHGASRIFKYRKKAIKEARCFIIAGKIEFDFIRVFFQNGKLPQKLVGRISPSYSLEADAIGTVEQLASLIRMHAINELIFGIDGFSAKEVISLMQSLPAGILFRFHFAGSVSIVGSDRKEMQGDYILLEDSVI